MKKIFLILISLVLLSCTDEPINQIKQGSNDNSGNIINIPELNNCRIFKVQLNDNNNNTNIQYLYITKCDNGNISTEYEEKLAGKNSNAKTVSNTINYAESN